MKNNIIIIFFFLIICLMFAICCLTTKVVTELKHENFILRMQHQCDSELMFQPIPDTCMKCGNSKVINLYMFNEDTIAKQKQIKKEKDEKFGHCKKNS